MIKPIDAIPESQSAKRRAMSRRQLICADIQEALEKGIYLFEFTGDMYNYKTLPQVAGEVSRDFIGILVRDYIIENNLRISSAHVTRNHEECRKIIKCVSQKQPDGTYRVFCEIHPDKLPEVCNAAEHAFTTYLKTHNDQGAYIGDLDDSIIDDAILEV